MQVILERVKIDLDEDEIRRLIDAVDHYEASIIDTRARAIDAILREQAAEAKLR